MEFNMCHIHSYQDTIWIPRGHNLSAPKVLMNETDSTLRCTWRWASNYLPQSPVPCGARFGFVSESAFLQDQPHKRKAATKCLNELESNTKQRRTTSTFGPPFDHRGGFVHQLALRPVHAQTLASVSFRHRPSCALWMCSTLLQKQWHFLKAN